MSSPYSTPPSTSTLSLSPFTISIPDSALSHLKASLQASNLAPETFENSQHDRKYGVTRDWLAEAKKEWEEKFDWREQEKKMNQFPHFKANVETGFGDEKLEVHFMALFSEKKDAVPLILSHGWPGSFLEFIPIFLLLTSRYTPSTLPYHLIAPSIPGYGFSSPPPTSREFGTIDVTTIFNNLMIGLGFGSGYIAHGGDTGSTISRQLAVYHESCKAAHTTLAMATGKPAGFDTSLLTTEERAGIKFTAEFGQDATAYMVEHRTRPSTIGLVLSSSPLALLAWVGEKYLTWTDEDPPLTEILTLISLYWLTNTISTTLYTYRAINPLPTLAGNPSLYIFKPFGFSQFPKEIIRLPESWVRATGNLVFYRKHEKGGHFASLEVPEVLLKDLEDFVGQVWKGVGVVKVLKAKL